MGTEAGPWVFEGEALLLWGRAGSRPLLLAAFHHLDPKAGPFVELVTGQLVGEAMTVGRGRLFRPALARVPLAVGSGSVAPVEPAVEPATLKWFAEGRRREVSWEERGVHLRAEISRTDVPGALPARLLVAGGAGARAGGRIPGRLAAAHVEVDIPEGDSLAPLRGRRLGALFSTTRTAGEPLRLRLSRRLEPVVEPS